MLCIYVPCTDVAPRHWTTYCFVRRKNENNNQLIRWQGKSGAERSGETASAAIGTRHERRSSAIVQRGLGKAGEGRRGYDC